VIPLSGLPEIKSVRCVYPAEPEFAPEFGLEGGALRVRFAAPCCARLFELECRRPAIRCS